MNRPLINGSDGFERMRNRTVTLNRDHPRDQRRLNLRIEILSKNVEWLFADRDADKIELGVFDVRQLLPKRSIRLCESVPLNACRHFTPGSSAMNSCPDSSCT